jgi:hypothetical protein
MRNRDWKSHAVEYDVCGGRLRLLPPLPFDVTALLKMLPFARGDHETVKTLLAFENKAVLSKDHDTKNENLR